MKFKKRNKKKFPLVSIIMNCRNGDRFLKQSVKSVIKQKYKNWELIFFDNFSEDKSIPIIKAFKNKKIRIIKSNKYLKLYHARNVALRYAKGKYIAFLDTDDLWHPSKLQIQVQYILKNKKDFVFSNFYFLEGEKKNINKQMSTFREGYVTQKLLNHYGLGILTVLMSKKLLKKKSFNSNYEIIGDFDFFIKLSLKNYFGYIQKPLAIYRVHSENFSYKKIDLWIKELENWISKNDKKYKRNGFYLKNQKMYLNKLKIKKIIKRYF